MGAAGRAQPTVNVAPARNAVLFDCLIDGAGGAPLALLLLALAFWLVLADLQRAPALYERRCSTRVDALEACVLGSVQTAPKALRAPQTPQMQGNRRS